MPNSNWDMQYNTGVGFVDREHRQLLESIQSVQDAANAKKDRDEILFLLGRLVDDTNVHFNSEEATMADNHYSGTVLHALKHRQLLEQMNSFVLRIDHGASLSGFSLGFLNNWLLFHVQEADHFFGLWLNEHGKR